jgi:hypothetical protein
MATKLNTTVTEYLHLLREVYGEGDLSIARVFECPERFSTGRQDVEEYEKPDRQVTTRTDGNVEKRTHVRKNRNFDIRIIVSRQIQSIAVGFCATTKRR